MNKPEMKKRPKMNFKVLGRTLKFYFKSYPVLVGIQLFCILFSAGISAMPSLFVHKVIAAIETAVDTNMSWEAASGTILPHIITLAVLYILALISTTLFN